MKLADLEIGDALCVGSDGYYRKTNGCDDDLPTAWVLQKNTDFERGCCRVRIGNGYWSQSFYASLEELESFIVPDMQEAMRAPEEPWVFKGDMVAYGGGGGQPTTAPKKRLHTLEDVFALGELPPHLAAWADLAVESKEHVAPASCFPLVERCAWYGKREPRADYQVPVRSFVIHKGCTERAALESKGVSAHLRLLEDQTRAAALMTFKRTVREWPICRMGGELKLTWQAGCAVWSCSTCQKRG